MCSSDLGRIAQYPKQANDEICVLVQIESQEALNHIEAIAAVDGIDGLFIGPADLSASLGHVGELNHPAVRAAIDDAFARIIKTGKAAGFLTADEELSRRSIDQGVTFMAVGLDVNLLARHTSALASRFKSA